MRVNLSNALNNIRSASEAWEKMAPSLPTLPNDVAPTDVSRTFEQVVGLLEVIQDAEVDGISWAIHKGNFDSLPSQLQQTIVPHVGNIEHFISQANNIYSWLWTLKSVSLQLIPIHSEAERASPTFAQEVSARIDVMRHQFSEAESLRDGVKVAHQSASVHLSEIAAKQAEVEKGVATVGELRSSVEAHERDALASSTSASSSAASADADAKAVALCRSDLEAAISKKDALFEEFNIRRIEIASLLENANKVGLARSFQEKRKSLTYTWIFWSLLFILAIAGLVFLSLSEILPLLRAGSPTPIAVAGRFMIASPFVWLAWFAARQYGHTLRISEDYAFKEAAAMAFAGYRNEVESDGEMLKLLRASAIRTFGSNPTDLLLKHPDAASPLHEALETALEKLEPKEIINAITSLLASLPKNAK